MALLLLILAFGLLIPWLGFYFDDWPVILVARLQDARGFWTFYQYDRPFSAWTYILTTPFVGVSPFGWHIFTFLVRWLTVLGMAWCLHSLWTERARRTPWTLASMVLLDQQPIAVAYSQHWISYAFYFLSLGCMIQAIRRPRWFWLFTSLSLATAAIHLFTMEYFLGLELLRPVVLWILLSGEGNNIVYEGDGSKSINTRWRSRKSEAGLGDSSLRIVSRAIKPGWAWIFWTPYLLLTIAYTIWRLFFLKFPAQDPNRPEVLIDLFHKPLGALTQIIQFALQDFINILFGPWYRAIDPLKIDLSHLFVVFSWIVAALVSLGVIFYLTHLKVLKPADRANRELLIRRGSTRQLLWFGLAALLLGLLPVWMIGRDSLTGLYGSRFTLAGLFGASIFWIGLIETFSDRRKNQIILVSILIGISVAFSLQRMNEFRWYWQDQTRFYWQLSWRAPYIEPGTVILSDGEIFQYVGRYSTSTALNLLYPQMAGRKDFAYWFLELSPGLIKKHEQSPQDRELQAGFRSFTFHGSTDRSILISYESRSGRCLWVLSPEDSDNPDLSQLTRDSAGLSDLSLIHPEPISSGYPPEAIFGPEPAHHWCYYYQKAELAHQLGDWDRVVSLGDAAEKLGYHPNNVQEWFPFIDAYARTGDWEQALLRTRQLLKINRALASRVCNLWEHITMDVDVPQDVEASFTELTGKYNKCMH
jgi:hypothetical protein